MVEPGGLKQRMGSHWGILNRKIIMIGYGEFIVLAVIRRFIGEQICNSRYSGKPCKEIAMVIYTRKVEILN